MTTFNYRLVRMDESSPDKECYEVHNVHAMEDGTLLTEGSFYLVGDTPAEIQHELHLIAADIYRSEPVLESALKQDFRDMEFITPEATDVLVNEILKEE